MASKGKKNASDTRASDVRAVPFGHGCANAVASILGVNGKSALRPFLRNTLGVYVSRDDTTPEMWDAAKDAIVARYIDGKSAKDARDVYRARIGG